MENLIAKMETEIDRLEDKLKRNLSEMERNIIIGKLEATKECLNWTEITQIENKYK